MFLSFEGIDGCGKTTQITLLAARLEALGQSVILTREPGGTALAEAIRGYLLHGREALSSRGELLLFGASRAQHVEEVIRPALERGDWVLSDRFGDSSVAYQGGGLGLSRDFVRQMNDFATGGLKPNLTLLFDIAPEVGQTRRAAREGADRIEGRGLEFQARVRAAYLEEAAREPDRFVILDASPPAKVVHQRVVRALQGRGVWAAG